MQIRFVAMGDDEATGFRHGDLDAYGNQPERVISDGDGNPCRHCLEDIPEGSPMLVLSYRPFSSLQPYAETGPILLCAEACVRHEAASDLPPAIANRREFIIRGYDNRERIVEGTGGVVSTKEMVKRAEQLLERDDVRFLHVRSATNNCFFCRIVRAE